MRVLEYLGESLDPRPMGSVGLGDDDTSRGAPSLTSVLVRAVAAAALVGGLLYFLRVHLGWGGETRVWVGASVTYVGLGYLLRPRPDTSNMGWLGGLVDDPFHYSDDVNRFLLFLAVVLYPGRFVGQALVDLLALPFRRRDRTPQRPAAPSPRRRFPVRGLKR